MCDPVKYYPTKIYLPVYDTKRSSPFPLGHTSTSDKGPSSNPLLPLCLIKGPLNKSNVGNVSRVHGGT